MAVMTTSPKKSEGQQITGKKHGKLFDKSRPITATLDHPLILDIKLLKKLDMTTFTKKGLIALSKFCGISLINKTDSKRKLNKCLKTIQYSNKHSGSECGLLPKGLTGDSGKRDCLKAKRKPSKQISKLKPPRIRFTGTGEMSGTEEDSSDVVCKRHDKPSSRTEGRLTKGDAAERRSMVDDIFNTSINNLVPEPCKTCSRSQHPERFHSHPRTMPSDKGSGRSAERINLEERFKNSLTTKDSEDSGGSGRGRKSPSARGGGGSPQKSMEEEVKSKTKTESPRKNGGSSVDLVSSPQARSKEKPKPIKKLSSVSSPELKSNKELQHSKKTNVRRSPDHKISGNISSILTVDDAMKFVTGCYICGRQVSPKMRMKHEESCITEWRAQNSQLLPEKRKAEPKRPDYRFLASGDLDFEGTFESIWANHKDSLVPCKKCGRKFFPDRIERHEHCCNNLSVTNKFKH